MTSAVRDWHPSNFTIDGLQFEPRIIQRDDGTNVGYELRCEVHRKSDTEQGSERIHYASEKVDSAEDVAERLNTFISQTVDVALLMQDIEDDIEAVFQDTLPEASETTVSRSSLGEVSLRTTSRGYTIHIDAEAVKRPDGFEFAADGWLGSDEADSIVAHADEQQFNTLDALGDAIESLYEELEGKRQERVAELNKVEDAVTEFEAPTKR